MTDAEILKALECCVNDDEGVWGFCNKGCPLIGKDEDCLKVLRKNALDLINRQTAEIEHLNVIIKGKNVKLNTSDYALEKSVLALANAIKTAKSEARKELAERLRKTMTATSKTISGYCKYIVTDDEIDNLLEEMEETK